MTNFSRISIVLAVIAIASCSKSIPTAPVMNDHSNSPDRILGNFPEPVQLFGDGYDAASADIAEILQGPGLLNPSQWGFPWENYNPSGEKWAVTVARIKRDEGIYGIEYRFAGEGTNRLSNIIELADESDEPILGDIRLPKVASCFIYINGHLTNGFVEVTIAYQWREDSEDPWAIRVSRMWFNPYDFENNLNNMYPEVIHEGYQEYYIIENDSGYGDIMPDVEYDPRYSGNLWLCFTRWTNSQFTSNRICIVKGSRAVYPHWNIINWENVGPKEAVVISDYNGYNPRIAIGECELYPLPYAWNKAVTYTNQQQKFSPAIIYCGADWNGSPQNELYEVVWQHWEFTMYGGGLPVIDIGPPNSNYGAVVWTQARSSSLNNLTVAFVDSLGNYGTLHETAGEDMPGSCMGSVAVHNYISGDIRSSVSYFWNQSVEEEYYWEPRAVFVDADTSGSEEVNLSGYIHEISEEIYGHWNVGSFVNHHYGMNTALTVFDNNFWMVWSGTDDGSAPVEVWGTYGNTDYD